MAGFETSSTPQSITRDWNCFKVLGTTKTYRAGTLLYRQGALAHDVYLIGEGVIKLIHSEQDGKETITGLGHTGWLLGAAPVIVQKPYPVTAVTLTPSSLHCVSAEDFLHLIKTDTQFSLQLHRIHCGEIYHHVTRLAELSLVPARQRLERLLRELGAIQAPANMREEIALHLPLKHWEIAELIAVTPEHLSRLLKVMQQDGGIRQEKGTVILLNPQKAA